MGSQGWHMCDPVDRPGPDSSPKQGQILPSIWVFKEHKSQTAFSFSPHTCLNPVYPCFFPFNPDFLLQLLRPSPSLPACLPACCWKNSHHKIAGRSRQPSSSSSHSLSTVN